MKTSLIFLLYSFHAFATHLSPEPGLYVCQFGNEESICDQLLQPKFFADGRLKYILVEYVGDCGSMGPYQYSCRGTQCEDPGLKFEFIDSTHYRWENKQYGFYCEFEKKKN